MINKLVYTIVFFCIIFILRANIVKDKDIIIYKAELLPLVADGILITENIKDNHNSLVQINLDYVNKHDSIVKIPDFHLKVKDNSGEKIVKEYKKWVDVEGTINSFNYIKPKNKVYIRVFFKVPSNIEDEIEFILKNNSNEKKYKLTKSKTLNKERHFNFF